LEDSQEFYNITSMLSINGIQYKEFSIIIILKQLDFNRKSLKINTISNLPSLSSIKTISLKLVPSKLDFPTM
jgi:hypothetical protein